MSLELLDAELADAVRSSSPEQRREIKLEICNRLLEPAGTPNSTLAAGVAAVKAGTVEERASHFQRMRALEQQMDAKYFHLQEEIDAGREPQGSEAGPFAQARAAEVVALALRDDSVDTLLDLLYVAHFALGADLDAVREAVAGVDTDRPRDSKMG